MIAFLLDWIFGKGKADAMVQTAERLRVAIATGNRMAMEAAIEEARVLLAN